MWLLTRKGELILRKLEILAYGDENLVHQALSCKVIGRQRTLSDAVDYILRHRTEPEDPAVRELWWRAAKAALNEDKRVQRSWRFGRS